MSTVPVPAVRDRLRGKGSVFGTDLHVPHTMKRENHDAPMEEGFNGLPTDAWGARGHLLKSPPE
jgi:hypothetical protein